MGSNPCQQYFAVDGKGVQLGVAVKGGLEIAAMRLKAVVALFPLFTLVTTDVANAFNEAIRAIAIEAMADAGFESMLDLVYFLYEETSYLYYRDNCGTLHLPTTARRTGGGGAGPGNRDPR